MFKSARIFRNIYITAVIVPFIFLLGLSLARNWKYPEIVSNYIGFANWAEILGQSSGLGSSLMLSLFISLTVAVLATSVGFIISRYVQYDKRRHFWSLITYFPYVLAPVVFGACLSYYFLKLGVFGTTIGVVLAQFIIAFPYAVIFFTPVWGKKLKQYEELSATLGSQSFQIFKNVSIPMSKGMIMICFFQTFLISWFEYGITSIIGVGKVQTLTVKVFLFIKESNFYFGAMSCCLLMIPPLILLYVNKKYVYNQMI